MTKTDIFIYLNGSLLVVYCVVHISMPGSGVTVLPLAKRLVSFLFRLLRAPAILSRARHRDAFESVKLSSDLPDRFWGGGAFSVLMYEYVPYLGWGLIRNPYVAKKGSFCVLAPFV